MRLIIVLFTSWLWLLSSCNLNSNLNADLPNTICELTKVIHESYPFYIDTLTQTCGIYNELMVTYFSEKPLRNILAKILDQKVDCGVIKFRVFENRDLFRSNKFLYTTYLSIEYLSSDGKKIRFYRRTDELFDRPGSAVGLDYSTSENYYMSKINGEWKIDSLVHDNQL